MFFDVTAYTLLQFPRGISPRWPRTTEGAPPECQHRLREQGADNKREDGDECSFVASIFRGRENGVVIERSSLEFVHLGQWAPYRCHRRKSDTVLG